MALLSCAHEFEHSSTFDLAPQQPLEPTFHVRRNLESLSSSAAVQGCVSFLMESYFDKRFMTFFRLVPTFLTAFFTAEADLPVFLAV
jgi:hypothetical protein